MALGVCELKLDYTEQPYDIFNTTVVNPALLMRAIAEEIKNILDILKLHTKLLPELYFYNYLDNDNLLIEYTDKYVIDNAELRHLVSVYIRLRSNVEKHIGIRIVTEIDGLALILYSNIYKFNYLSNNFI
jgi:hypothetical protein